MDWGTNYERLIAGGEGRVREVVRAVVIVVDLVREHILVREQHSLVREHILVRDSLLQ
jgi:hypothetical protein